MALGSLWVPGMEEAWVMAPEEAAVALAGAWALALDLVAAIVVGAAWVGEPGLAEPGNEVWGRGSSFPRKEVGK